MPTLAEARQIASTRGWLSRTPPAFRATVLERTVLQSFAASEAIYGPGDPPGGAYGLIEGGLRVAVAPGQHGPYIAHFFRPGAWIGDTSAVTGQPRLVGLAASRNTVVLFLPLHAINDILNADPGAFRSFFLNTQMHLETAVGAIGDLMIRDQTKRLAAILLRLGGCRDANPPGSETIEVDLSQEDIAAMANVSRGTANTILGQIEAEGCIRRSYRRIQILQPERMRARLRD